MPKYQIEREGQTFSTFFSFFFYPSNQISTTTKKIDPDLDAKKNLKGASSVKKKKKAKNSFPPFETKKESKGSA